MNKHYSVLMSVYDAENPVNLRQSIDSIKSQDFPASEIVLVIDGPINAGLTEVINSYPEIKRIQLPNNLGLGGALNEGLKHVSYDIVARMDSDDIASPSRMGKQFAKMIEGYDLISAPIWEFNESTSNIIGKRDVPCSQDEIISYSHKRNPFNHPCVMFRKSAVEAAGGYSSDYLYFEDYDLWVRMLKNGAKAMNLSEPLLYMRTDEGMYLRRGGKKYASVMLNFHKHLLNTGWTTKKEYITGALPHAIVCVMPEFIRRVVYRRLHKKH
ncbi:MAG: glycosyltransferase [Saccharofermentans sp.]|nr:glycosyltransferase [Saccharofermentans sp.]